MKKKAIITKECGLCKLVMEGADSPDLCGFCADITANLRESPSLGVTVTRHDWATDPPCADCVARDKDAPWSVDYDVTVDGGTLALCRLCALSRSHGEVPSPPEVKGQLTLFAA